MDKDIADIQASIHGLIENGVDLTTKLGRRFLMKDDLYRLKKGGATKKPYHVYLFNDIILYAEKLTSKKVVTLKYVTHMNIKDIFFIECSDSKDRYGFGILLKGEKKKMKFVAKNCQQKSRWKLSIEQQIERCCPTDTTFVSGEAVVTPDSPRNSWGNMGDFMGFPGSLSSTSDLDGCSGDDQSSTDSPNNTSHIPLNKHDDWSSCTTSGDEGSTEDTDETKSEGGDESECEQTSKQSDGTVIIPAANLHTIVWWLISYGDFNDPILIRTFLYSCTGFTTSQELFNNLMHIYDLVIPVPKAISLRYSLCDTRKRVTYFLKIWLEYFFERDFVNDGSLYEQLLKFFGDLRENNQNLEANVLKLIILRVNKKRLMDSYGMNRFSQLTVPQGNQTPTKPPRERPSSLPSPMPQAETKLLDWNVTSVAEQFVLIEFALFKAVDLREISNLAWKSEQPRKTAINVVNIFNRFENVSQWAATEVVMAQSSRQRVVVIEKLIQLAQKCAELRNYNSLMEIVAGLNRGSVQRLKKAWEAVAHTSRESFRTLNSVVDSLQNYKTYREQLKKAAHPCLPYFGIFLRDLTFTDVGNPVKINQMGAELINFEKIYMTSRILKDVQMFQRTPYTFDEDESLQPLLRRLLAMPEEMLYKHSQLAEQSAVFANSC